MLSNVGHIKSARFTTNRLYGVDELSFEAVASAVPEPASKALIGPSVPAPGFLRALLPGWTCGRLTAGRHGAGSAYRNRFSQTDML